MCRLPEGPLVALAELGGDIWYRPTPERAAQARRNLGRVAKCAGRDATGRTLGPRAAATTRARSNAWSGCAFRHAARYYLEVARTPALRPDDLDRRLAIETPDTVRRPSPGGPSSSSASTSARSSCRRCSSPSRVGGAVAPMETLDDPELQDWFVRTRGAVGVRIVGLREARRELPAALRDGTSVGLVGDRDLTGGGTLTELFGAPAPLPLGPAMLAVETGRRSTSSASGATGTGGYIGRLEPSPSRRRDRVASG